jgi:hypothetical protein
MKIIITESQYKRILREEEEQKVLHIPSLRFFNKDWDLLQKFLERKGNPPYSIGGNLFLNPYKHKIESFGNLISVEKNLYYTNSNDLTSLGKLTSVGGTLDIQGSKNITSLGELTSVGDSQISLELYANLNLSDCVNLTDLGKLTSLRAGLNLSGCKKLTSLGNLTSVGDNTSMGGTFSIGGYLNLIGCKSLIDLGNLTSVSGNMSLSSTNIESFNKLKYVGGYLDLRNSVISKKYSEEEIRNMVNVGGEIIM